MPKTDSIPAVAKANILRNASISKYPSIAPIEFKPQTKSKLILLSNNVFLKLIYMYKNY